jgi:hypothetical protein
MTTAWHDGFTDGRADKKLELRSDFIWYAVNSTDDYEREYAQGYRFGWKHPMDIITIIPTDRHYVGHKFILKEETENHFLGWPISVGQQLFSTMNPEKNEPLLYPKFAWTKKER